MPPSAGSRTTDCSPTPYKDQIDQLHNRIKTLRESNQRELDLKNEIDSLVNDRMEIQLSNDELASTAIRHAQENTKLRGLVEELRLELHQEHDQTQRLSNRCAHLESDYSSLKKQLRKEQGCRSALTDNIMGLHIELEKCREYKNLADKANDMIDAMADEIDVLQSRLQQLSSTEAQDEQYKQKMNKLLEAHEAAYASAASYAHNLEIELADFKNVQKKLRVAQSQVVDLERDLARCHKIMKQAKSAIEKKDAALKEIKTENKNLRNEFQAKEKRLKDDAVKLANAQVEEERKQWKERILHLEKEQKEYRKIAGSQVASLKYKLHIVTALKNNLEEKQDKMKPNSQPPRIKMGPVSVQKS